MSTAVPEGHEPDAPLIPQPASNPEELRAAVAQIMRESLPTFDAERAAALHQARTTGNAAPMRRFVGQWAVYVAIHRYPDRAARMQALESAAAQADNVDEARTAADEIGRILDQAFAEASLDQGESDR